MIENHLIHKRIMHHNLFTSPMSHHHEVWRLKTLFKSSDRHTIGKSIADPRGAKHQNSFKRLPSKLLGRRSLPSSENGEYSVENLKNQKINFTVLDLGLAHNVLWQDLKGCHSHHWALPKQQWPTGFSLCFTSIVLLYTQRGHILRFWVCFATLAMTIKK